ncbi:MAG TPA: hypothetical protein VJS42_03140 [Steroidobacteraceae bacterium]|nr:hypothetical protein [Steroidobacteraceae bacterium]
MGTRVFAACVSAAVIFLYGCGGGGGNDDDGGNPPAPPAPATAAGVFKDSNVSGLSYTSGAQSGVTDANGTFTYETGQNVTFKVGPVTIGTASGKSVITPVDLVASGASTSITVQNIVRFLMLMDRDGDASNGITISQELRDRASSANWPSIDFAADLDATLASTSIIGDTSVDGSVRSLPSAAGAKAHLESTVRCLYSGFFTGNYTGDDKGRWIAFLGVTGSLAGAAYSTEDEELIPLGFSPSTLPVAQSLAFVAGIGSTGSDFSGSFTTLNDISGTWSGGNFSGSRAAGSATAVYKFQTTLVRGTPQSPGTVAGGIFFDIASNNQVTATAVPDIRQSNQGSSVTASLSDNNLTADMSSGPAITATVNTTAMTLSGTWSAGSDSGFITGIGCKLN